MARFERLLITGAAGRLGTVLRRELAPLAAHLRLSDMAEMAPAGEREEIVQCDLADKDAVMEMTRDVDAVVHFGGVALEGTFDAILSGNIVGSYNIYEGCRKNGVARIVYASSNHAVGFHPRNAVIDATAAHRPDSIYGLSKCFVEDLGRYYFDKFGVETVALRIGSSFPEPMDRRMLATWLSFADCAELVRRSLIASGVGFTVSYGSSANKEQFWDNRHAAHLGYEPKDSAEGFREKLEAETPLPDPHDPAVVCVGGSFAASGHFEDET